MAKLTNELPQTTDFDNKQVWASDGQNTELISFEEIRQYLNEAMVGCIEKFVGKPDVFVEGGLEYRLLKLETLDNTNGEYDLLKSIWGTLEINADFLNKTQFFGKTDSAFSSFNNGNVLKHVHGISVEYQSQPQIRHEVIIANFYTGTNTNIPLGTIGYTKPELIAEQGLFFDNAKTIGQTGETADYTCGENVSCKYYYVSRVV